ncbi:MAG TPA: amidohydrolase family protein, partial [Candidatus Tectomicrobia bacterium]|nr:amidohydrolase family protein [Candidatus Tectomicrobia bacterium]
AHPHLDREGLKARGGVPIAGLGSVAEIVEVVRRAAASAKPGEWIVLMPMGSPLDYVSRPEQLREGRFPTRHDLDAVAPDNPVYIRAVWGWWSHRPFPSIANSRALALAGVTRDTPAPHNVEIVRDDRGEPTGVFLERNYAPILEYTLFRALPRFTLDDRIEGVRLACAAYSAAGTTSGYEGHGVTPAVMRAYRTVHARGEQTLRMQLPFSVPSAALDDRAVRDLLYHCAGVASERGLGDGLLTVEGITLDAVDPRVAEAIASGYPYEQWAGHFYQALSFERLVELGTLAARLGLRVNCLVCYDLETVLRAWEAVDREVSIRDRRWVAIHVTQATPEQIRRIKALGLVCTVTPNFMYMASDRFGLDRLGERGTPIRDLLDAGVPVALSTDNVPYSMLWTMWEALARWDGDAGRRLGESGLTREEALRISVQSGHLLTWSEDRRGVIEPGRDADLVVLDGDPLTCAEDALPALAVDLTIVGGRIVHERRPGTDGKPAGEAGRKDAR